MNSLVPDNNEPLDDLGQLHPNRVVSSVLRAMDCEEPWSEINESVLQYCAMQLITKDLTSPYNYLQSKPGKDLRGQLITNFNVWLQVPETALNVIIKVVEMLHTSSLLYLATDQADVRVDDVEDRSGLRRGFAAAHIKFGVPQTINSANYIYFCALRELGHLQNPGALTIFCGAPATCPI